MPFTDTPDSIYALLTDLGRHNLARAALGEISTQVTGFDVGRSGYQDLNPVKIIPIDTSQSTLIDHFFPNTLGPNTTLSTTTGISVTTKTFDAVTLFAIGQKISLAVPYQVVNFSFDVNKIGDPQGQLILRMVKDDGFGLPSTNPADLILLRAYDCTTLASGIQTLLVDALHTQVDSDFHIVVQPDDTYNSTFVAGNQIEAVYEASGFILGEKFNSIVWSADTVYYRHTLVAQLVGAPTQKPYVSLEFPTPKTIVVNCRLAPQESISALGEVGLWCTIVNSTVSPAEIGTVFMLAVAHMPLQVKTRRQASIYRFIIQF